MKRIHIFSIILYLYLLPLAAAEKVKLYEVDDSYKTNFESQRLTISNNEKISGQKYTTTTNDSHYSITSKVYFDAHCTITTCETMFNIASLNEHDLLKFINKHLRSIDEHLYHYLLHLPTSTANQKSKEQVLNYFPMYLLAKPIDSTKALSSVVIHIQPGYFVRGLSLQLGPTNLTWGTKYMEQAKTKIIMSLQYRTINELNTLLSIMVKDLVKHQCAFLDQALHPCVKADYMNFNTNF